VEAGEATSYSSEPAATGSGEDAGSTEVAGSLASDEALQALREKLTGGNQ
jgi:small subunit ribosomal protein S1